MITGYALRSIWVSAKDISLVDFPMDTQGVAGATKRIYAGRGIVDVAFGGREGRGREIQKAINLKDAISAIEDHRISAAPIRLYRHHHLHGRSLGRLGETIKTGVAMKRVRPDPLRPQYHGRCNRLPVGRRQ